MLKNNGFSPDFERVKTALEFKEPDRVPNFESFVSRKVRESILGRDVPDGLAGELSYRVQFGYDFIYMVPPYKKQPVYSRTRHDLQSDQTGENRQWIDQHSNMIADWDSFRSYKDYPDPVCPLDLTELRQAVETAGKLPGYVGVGALLPSCPYTEINLLMGYENFSMALYEDPELCRAIIDKCGKVGVAGIEQLVALDIDFIFFGDDMAYTGGMIISPQFMREFFFPWYRKFIQIARDAGKYIIFHSDGDIEAVIPDFIDAGLNGLNPIEPAAMDIVKLKKMYGDKLALTGNIDVDLLSRGSTEDVIALTGKRIEELKSGGGFLLGSSNSVCDYVNHENYIAMLNANYEFGKYGHE